MQELLNQNEQKLEAAILKLLAPLKDGMKLFNSIIYKGFSVQKNAVVFLFEVIANKSSFKIVLLARREGDLWQIRTKHFHLKSESVNDLEIKTKDAALKALAKLVIKNESAISKLELDFVLEHVNRESGKPADLRRSIDNKLHIRINTACQLDCIFCNAKEGLENTILDDQELLQTLNDSQLEDRKYVIFTGGEPTLNSHLPEFCKHAIKLGAKQIIIQSNAIKLAKNRYLEQFEDFKDKLAWGFSIHSSTEKNNDIVVNSPGILARQWQGVQNSIKAGHTFSITFVITKITLEETTEFVRQVHKLCGKYKNFYTLFFAFPILNGNAWENANLMPTCDELVLSLIPALDLADELGLKVLLSESSFVPRCMFYKHGREDLLKFFEAYPDANDVYQIEWQKLDDCKLCQFTKICPGVFTRYLDRYPETKVFPIK